MEDIPPDQELQSRQKEEWDLVFRCLEQLFSLSHHTLPVGGTWLHECPLLVSGDVQLTRTESKRGTVTCRELQPILPPTN